MSVQNLLARNLGYSLSASAVKKLDFAGVDALLPETLLALAVKNNVELVHRLGARIHALELVIREHLPEKAELGLLKGVPGIGEVLGVTVLLETGPIERFARVGNYASYARCVDSQRLSNGKKKGEANRKNGNRYLAWAFVEAANFAVRY